MSKFNKTYRRIMFGLALLFLVAFGIATLSPFRLRPLQHDLAVKQRVDQAVLQ